MKPRELTIRGLILGALITTVFTASNVYLGLNAGLIVAFSNDAPIGIVGEDFTLAPWLGVLGFLGAIVLLYGWMLRRSAAAR